MPGGPTRLAKGGGPHHAVDRVRLPGGLRSPRQTGPQLGRRAVAERCHGRRNSSARRGPQPRQLRRLQKGAHRRMPKRVCVRRGSVGLVARLPHDTRACCMSLSTAAKVLTVEKCPGDATWGASYMAWAAYAARGARIKSRSVSHGGRESWPPCRCTDNSSARGVKIPMG